MIRSLVKWGLFFGALLALGPLAWLATGTLRGADGGATTPILSASPMVGLLRALAAVGLAAGVGMVTARVVSLPSAYFNAGIVLTWAAFGTASVDEAARASGLPGLAWRWAVEGAVMALAGGGAAWVIARAAPTSASLPATLAERAAQTPAKVVWLPGAIALVGGLIGAWLVAQNALKGQAIAAAGLGAMLGAAGAVMLFNRAHAWAVVAGVMAAAVVAPVLGGIMHGGSPDRGFVAAASTATGLVRFAAVLPMDWLAGALLGVPTGLSLGGWIGEGSDRPQASGSPAAT